MRIVYTSPLKHLKRPQLHEEMLDSFAEEVLGTHWMGRTLAMATCNDSAPFSLCRPLGQTLKPYMLSEESLVQDGINSRVQR